MHSFKLPIIITRGNNVFGPRQYPEKVISKFIKQLLNDEKCTLHGDGSSKKKIIHVEDVASCVVTNCYRNNPFEGKIGEVYNIGSDHEFTVLQIAEKIIKIQKQILILAICQFRFANVIVI